VQPVDAVDALLDQLAAAVAEQPQHGDRVVLTDLGQPGGAQPGDRDRVGVGVVGLATAPTAQQVVGYSTDGKVWSAVAPLTSASLPAGLLAGVYGGDLLTRKAGSFKLFAANAWGDPRKVSRFAPRLRRVAPIKVKRLRSGAFVVSTRLSTPSQALVLPTRRRLLQPGEFPVTVRVPKTRRSVVITAVDPYGRRATFTLSFRAP